MEVVFNKDKNGVSVNFKNLTSTDFNKIDSNVLETIVRGLESSSVNPLPVNSIDDHEQKRQLFSHYIHITIASTNGINLLPFIVARNMPIGNNNLIDGFMDNLTKMIYTIVPLSNIWLFDSRDRQELTDRVFKYFENFYQYIYTDRPVDMEDFCKKVDKYTDVIVDAAMVAGYILEMSKF